ncbi:MAG: YybS family protein [Bacillota bacterium]|nr:YybS family protein [Bacillota bacterium]
MRDNNTRAIANAALATALSVIIAVIGLFVPLLSLASLLWPAPIIITIKRYGFRYGIYATIASGLIVGMISEPLYAIYVILGYGAVGLAIGYGVEKTFSAGRTLLIASLASLVSKVILVYAITRIMGVNPIEVQFEAMKEAFEFSTGIYKNLGIDRVEDINNMFMTSLQMLKVTLPALLISASVLDSFLNYSVARLILRRFKLSLDPLPSFGEWRFPNNISLGFLLLVALTFIGGYLGLENTQVIMSNIFLLFNMVFLIQGLSLIYYFLTVKGVAKAIKVFLLVIIMFNQTLAMGAVFAGLLDVIFDFRKLSVRKN